MNFKFKCPRCGAEPQKHGKGDCLNRRSSECEGIICECYDDKDSSDCEDHGVTFVNRCKSANCYHCGWGGTLPKKPKGTQAWEKKALDAGWTPPADRAAELGL